MTSFSYFDGVDDAVLSQINIPDAANNHSTDEQFSFSSEQYNSDDEHSNQAEQYDSNEEYVPGTPPLQHSDTSKSSEDEVPGTPQAEEEPDNSHMPFIDSESFKEVTVDPSIEDNIAPLFQFPQVINKNTETVLKYVGKNVVKNTIRKNNSSMRVFKNFIFAKIDFSDCDYAQGYDNFILFTSRTDINENTSSFDEKEEFDLLRKLLFPDFRGSFLPDGFSDWSDDHLRHLQFFLAEFAVRYRQKDGNEVTPNSMKSYIFGIQRFLSEEWNYTLTLTSGNIFGCA